MKINYSEFETFLRSKNKRNDTIYNYVKRIKELPQNLLHDPARLNRFIYKRWSKTPSVIDIATAAVRTYYASIGKKEWAVIIEKPGWRSGREMRYLTKEQVERIRGMLNFPMRVFFELYYETGIRRSVLLELRLKDVDFDKSVIHVSRDYTGNKAKVDYVVYFGKELGEMIREFVKRRIATDVLVSDDFRYDIWIKRKEMRADDRLFEFYYMIGGKLRPHDNPRDLLTKLFIRSGEAIGIELRPHIIRHTAGTEIYGATKDILATRDSLGQTTVAAAERYAHTGERSKETYEKRFAPRRSRRG